MQIVVHIGLIKTASSFFQTLVFPELNDHYHYSGPTKNWPSRDAMVSPEKRVLISNENLSGNPLLYKEYGLTYFQQFSNCVTNIKSAFNQPKIVVGFREPASFIRSVYKQHLHEGGSMHWAGFLEQYEDSFIRDLKFSRFVEVLQTEFLAENLFLYTLDEVVTTKSKLLEDFAEFLKIPQINVGNGTPRQRNEAVPDRYVSALILSNRLSNSVRRFAGFRPGFRFGSFIINSTTIFRDFFPRFFGKGTATCDLLELREYFQTDWTKTRELIDSIRTKSGEGLR